MSFDFDVKFHYPFIFYGYEKNEIWVQKVDDPYKIRRYVFVNTITAFDLTDDVFFETQRYKFANSLGLVLTYENHHKIAEFSFDEYYSSMRRVQKPIKFSELPNANILSFVKLEGKNDKNSLEPCIMFHYLNQVKFYYLKSGKIKKQYDKRFATRNIIPYNERIFFWEDRGRTIERLDIPILKDEKTFFYKVYDAKNAIKLCKKTTFLINGYYEDCLLIWDEDRFIKILYYDTQNKKFRVEKEYFVSSSFAVYDEPNILESYWYWNGILYSNTDSYLLQERGTEKEDIAIQVKSIFLNYFRILNNLNNMLLDSLFVQITLFWSKLKMSKTMDIIITVKTFLQSPHEIEKISVVKKIWCKFRLFFIWINTKI